MKILLYICQIVRHKFDQSFLRSFDFIRPSKLVSSQTQRSPTDELINILNCIGNGFVSNLIKRVGSVTFFDKLETPIWKKSDLSQDMCKKAC